MTYTCHCRRCGRFCLPADSSTPFGGPLDYEPPDEEFYCGPCVETEKAEHLRQGWLPSNWVPARWEYEVATALGFIRIRMKGCAWSIWHRAAEPVPDDWEAIPKEDVPPAYRDLV